MHRFPGCTLVAIPCRPESRGWLRITSPDPAKPPAIQPNYLATQRDKDTMVAGLKVSRRIFAHPAMRAYVTEEYMPGPAGDTDEDLLNHVRATAGTTFHQTSTCMMGPGPMAVVDTVAAGEGHRAAAGDRCLDHADGGVGQHQRDGHHDRREGRGHDPARGIAPRALFRTQKGRRWAGPGASLPRPDGLAPLPWFWFVWNSETARCWLVANVPVVPVPGFAIALGFYCTGAAAITPGSSAR